MAYTGFLGVVLIGFATYTAASGGLWIVGLVLFWPLVTTVLFAIVPPTYERGYPQLGITFALTFFTVFLSVFLADFFVFVSAYVILGASTTEIQEHLGLISAPLGLLSPQFVITTKRSFVDVCGILLGNSFLIAIPVFLSAKVVQYFLHRNQVTQIGLVDSRDQADE